MKERWHRSLPSLNEKNRAPARTAINTTSQCNGNAQDCNVNVGEKTHRYMRMYHYSRQIDEMGRKRSRTPQLLVPTPS